MPTLRELLPEQEIVDASGDLDVPVSGISYDSRKVEPGDVFVCIEGFKADGHLYAGDALRKGAVAVVAERELAAPIKTGYARVRDTRLILGMLASRFYDYPSRRLRLIGVTGTNGKTTTTHLIKAILEAAGHRVGLIGTIHNLIGDVEIPTERTTPESLDLQRLLAHMVDSGCTYAVMEVSSHAVELRRLVGTDFDIGVFTNLTQDHLDFHRTLEAYRAAKGKFFASLGAHRKPGPRFAIVNADDPQADYFSAVSSVSVHTYAIDRAAECRASDLEFGHEGIRYRLVCAAGTVPLSLRMAGRFNVYNSLAAAAVGLYEGVGLATIEAGLSGVKGVSGRMELVSEGQDFAVVVDYAHTPDGLENLLLAARDLGKGRRIVVFGCGGDRDRGKRPIMGEIAGRLADYVVVTSDNPRSEDPGGICAEVARGVGGSAPGSTHSTVMVDRREAIAHAIRAARTGDVVLIAGKGHETYQIFADRTIHFDDQEVAREVLRDLVRGGDGPWKS